MVRSTALVSLLLGYTQQQYLSPVAGVYPAAVIVTVLLCNNNSYQVEEFLSCDVRRGRWRYKAQHSAVRDRTKSNNASRRYCDKCQILLLGIPQQQ